MCRFGGGRLTDRCLLEKGFISLPPSFFLLSLSLQVVKTFIVVSSFNRTEALAGDEAKVWRRSALYDLMHCIPPKSTLFAGIWVVCNISLF